LPEKPKPNSNNQLDASANDEVMEARLKLKKRFSNSGQKPTKV